ncbi:hypothetical protein FBY30_0266 [Arthrobacter sp. SLBN-83]|nr:hypothetical protein FBY30_0266 [Arthrobacter sp. SLBN-83]
MKVYNSPDNWPRPPAGWQPHEGWHPDPAWGPAPPGHEFWVDIPAAPFSSEPRDQALTTTALVLAAVAIVLCWIPLLNLLAFLLGISAVVLGVIALVAGRRADMWMRGGTVTALVMGALSVVGVILFQAAYSSGPKESTNPRGVSAAAEASIPSPSQTPTVARSPEAAEGSAENPRPVGAAAVVGNEYQVQVASVKLDATEEVVANNMFNKPPKGRYILVDLAVTYAGAKEGNPWLDLSPTFVGTDARQYDASACGASLDNGAMNVPTLEKGGQANYQVCMDVPTGAIEGGKIFIQKSFSTNSKSRVYWGLR